MFKNFLNLAPFLTLAALISGVSFADQHQSTYVDDEGFCVVNIHPSNPIKYIQQKVIDVPDIKGHVVRLFEAQQKIAETTLCNGDSLLSAHWYAMTDFIDHDGNSSGYIIFDTKKGDQMILKVTGNCQKKSSEDLSEAQVTGRVIGGSGALAAVEGHYQRLDKFNRHKEMIKPISNQLRYKILDKDTKN